MNNSNIIEYLKNHTFEKHENGNMFRYGLNSWGCDSVISYNNDIWKFIAFVPNKSDAEYINKNGEIITIVGYDEGISRMQEIKNQQI
jgi:hypothetical protein